jgi:thioesterase domain-containing protein/acyl carrier protein
LAESLPDEVATAEGLVRPRDEVEERLAVIWEDLLQVRSIGATDDFFDLGGHSLLAVRLAARIEEQFGRTIALSDLLLGSTIEELAGRLREPAGSRASSLLIDLDSRGHGRPLVLVHPIGGGILCYNALVRYLGGAGPILGLQAAGVEDDAEPETDLTRMASRYVDVLRAKDPEGPYLLAGWSMGGVVAFEMARQLTAAGRDVPLVFLIDCSVPRPQGVRSPLDDRESLLAFAADLARASGRETWGSLEQLRGLDLEAITNGTLDRSILDHEIAREIGPDRLRRLHGVFQANRRALDSYQPRPYHGSVILVEAESSRAWFQRGPARGWRGLALGGVTTYRVPGDHYTILQQPSVERIAEILAGEIHRLEGTNRGTHSR